MKALTLTQPWASLVALGEKRVETRGWSTNYRGTIAIHAAKSFPAECQRIARTQPFLQALGKHGYGWDILPRGEIIALANIMAVRRIDLIFFAAFFRMPENEQEIAFGDYSSDRFAWRLSDIRRLPETIPCKGALGLWTVPDDIWAVVVDSAMRAELAR